MFNNLDLIQEITIAILVFASVSIFSECISWLYNEIMIKKTYEFVIYNLDSGFYYTGSYGDSMVNSLFLAARIPVPKDKKSYLKTFLLHPIGQKLISSAKTELDLRIGFRVIDPNTYKIIKDIAI